MTTMSPRSTARRLTIPALALAVAIGAIAVDRLAAHRWANDVFILLKELREVAESGAFRPLEFPRSPDQIILRPQGAVTLVFLPPKSYWTLCFSSELYQHEAYAINIVPDCGSGKARIALAHGSD